jgi:hypothetical protein
LPVTLQASVKQAPSQPSPYCCCCIVCRCEGLTQGLLQGL